MKDNLGFGVLIKMLEGNRESAGSYVASLNKKIEKILLSDDTLRIHFYDKSILVFADKGQSCCEHRFMVCDDDLKHFHDAVFRGGEIKSAPSIPYDYGEHEVQFLEIHTDKGSFIVSSHNEHNGYYGGFAIRCHIDKDEK